MSVKIVKGKEIASKILDELSAGFKNLDKKPVLELFLSVDDPVIKSYVKIKEKYAKRLGADFKLTLAPNSHEEFKRLLKNSTADGVVVQLPLGSGFSYSILDCIDPKKDIDVLSGRAFEKYKNASLEELERGGILIPPVAGAVLQIIKEYEIKPQNMNILIVGCGKLVGRPVFELFKKFYVASLECVDKRTDLQKTKSKLLDADLIVSGAGVPGLIKKEDIKEGVILIDAGTSGQKSNYAILGDIDKNCADKASVFSSTPGGIGPITIAMLFKNLYLACKMQNI